MDCSEFTEVCSYYLDSDENVAADDYFQCLICDADPGDVIKIDRRIYYLDGLVPANPSDTNRLIRIDKAITIDFNGSEIRFRDLTPVSGEGAKLWNKGFGVFPVVPREEFPRIVFRNGLFIGDETTSSLDQYKVNYAGVLTSFSGVQIGQFLIEDCVFRNLSAGVAFNAYKSDANDPADSGYIRQAILRNCTFENIVVDETVTDNEGDNNRGRAATFQMQVDKDIDSHAFSLGNTFRKCERHSLYVFSGGPFLSEGDTFYDGSDGRHGWPARLKWEDAVAAIALKGGTGGKVETQTDAFQGGSHMRISNAYFENCRDCINLSRATPEYPPGVTIQKFFDVSITDCKFVDTLRRDILLNNGDPDVTGLWANIVVERTKHINQSGAYPFETGVPIQLVVASFQDMVLRDIELHIREGGDYSIITTLNCMLIYGRGSSSEFASNNLVIERVIGNCEPVSESNITAQRVIQVHNSVYKPGETDDVIIRDVTAPAGVTPVNPTSGSNTHYKVNVNPYNL